MRSVHVLGAALIACAPVAAQADWRRLGATPTLPAGPSAALDPAPAAGTGRFALDPEALAVFVATQPNPVSRELLEGEAESWHRYQGLPGGIVLGRVASVPDALEGARLARGADGLLGLTLRERFVALPPHAAERRNALARFVESGRDALVDLAPSARGAARLAPELAGTDLAEALVRLDRVPHALFPSLQACKTLIVDRQPRVVLVDDGLAWCADLEIRAYDATPDGRARRRSTLEALDTDTCGPRVPGDAGPALAPLSEIAGCLGFLRWIRATDPEGWAREFGPERE